MKLTAKKEDYYLNLGKNVVDLFKKEETVQKNKDIDDFIFKSEEYLKLLKDMNLKPDQVEKILPKANKIISNMGTEFSSIIEIVERLKEENEVLNQLNINLKIEKNQLKTELNKVEDQTPVAEEAEHKLRILEDERNEYRAECIDLKHKVNDLELNLDVETKRVIELSSNNEYLEKELIFIESKFEKSLLRLKEKEDEIAGVEGEKIHLKSEIKKYKSDVAPLEKENKKLHKEIEDSKEVLFNLLEEVKALKESE